ncbi:MAG: NADH-quinone oxidoreductase subunit M [Deltaproteobacteria bacterium]|nr:MAG: NADH-quinone oxidoreductase subunit M [Deltaproteobacteria bacterium]
MNPQGWLVALLALPVAGTLVLWMTSKQAARLHFALSLLVSFLTLGVTLVLWFGFPPKSIVSLNTSAQGLSFQQTWFMLGSIPVKFQIGLDGISFPLVLLTNLLCPIALLGSWDSEQPNSRGYLSCLLLIQAGLLGIFLSLDLLLFFLYWEFLLVPSFFLLGRWGGAHRGRPLAMSVLLPLCGSFLLLAALLFLGIQFNTFSLPQLYQESLAPGYQFLLFGFVGLAFALRIPLFPFHTWMADTHTEHPTAGTILLSGIALKTGFYGFLRIAIPLFPEAWVRLQQPLMIVTVFGVVYLAFLALVQIDMKKVVVYIAMSHMGLIMLGAFSLNLQGLQGSLLHTVGHGLAVAGLFLVLGSLEKRRGTRLFSEFGGLSQVTPALSFFALVFLLSLMGLPGLGGFVGELLVVTGLFGANKVYATLVVLCLLLLASLMVWTYRRCFLGGLTRAENYHLKDLQRNESLAMLMLALLVLALGLFPSTLLRHTRESSQSLIRHIQERSGLSRRSQAPESKRFRNSTQAARNPKSMVSAWKPPSNETSPSYPTDTGISQESQP